MNAWETTEMKIAVPEIKGGRSVSASELECRIDPNTFEGKWLEHQPTTINQKMTLDLYLDARAKGRLHAFTCMTIDPSVQNGKVVYQKGLPIETNFPQEEWEKMLKDYNPSRNSRQLARTEYANRNLYLIQEYVKSGYGIVEAWEGVCDSSEKFGHYMDSINRKYGFEPTGSREVCGFCDLGNAGKLIAEDPWAKTGGFWFAPCYYNRRHIGKIFPIAWLVHFQHYAQDLKFPHSVGLVALD